MKLPMLNHPTSRPSWPTSEGGVVEERSRPHFGSLSAHFDSPFHIPIRQFRDILTGYKTT